MRICVKEDHVSNVSIGFSVSQPWESVKSHLNNQSVKEEDQKKDVEGVRSLGSRDRQGEGAGRCDVIAVMLNLSL